MDQDLHPIFTDLPLIRGFAERRERIQAGFRAYLEERNQRQNEHVSVHLAWQREKLAAIEAGQPLPPEPEQPNPGRPRDGDFMSVLADVDNEEREIVAGTWRDIVARARAYEDERIAEAITLPPTQWGPILADLGLLCRTVRQVMHAAAIAHAIREDHINEATPGGSYRAVREDVDEVDLVAAWKQGFYLVDPIVADEPVTLSQLRGGVQRDRRPSGTVAAVRRQHEQAALKFGTHRTAG